MRYLYLLFIFVLLSCKNRFQNEPIAELYDQKLYFDEIINELPKNEIDTNYFIENFISFWIRENLLLNNAKINLPSKQKQIDKKTQDYLHYVGKVQVEFISPKYREVVVNDDTSLSVSAQMSSAGQVQVGDFELYLNNNLIHTGQGFPIYTHTINNISEGGKLKIKGIPSGQSDFGETEININKSPSISNEDIPSQVLDGININSSTSVTLVLNAPNKNLYSQRERESLSLSLVSLSLERDSLIERETLSLSLSLWRLSLSLS